MAISDQSIRLGGMHADNLDQLIKFVVCVILSCCSLDKVEGVLTFMTSSSDQANDCEHFSLSVYTTECVFVIVKFALKMH